MVAKARELHPDIQFQIASAQSLPFPDESFDVVTGNFVLHHSSEPEKVLRESFRVLREGGRIGFTVWADIAKLEAFRIFFSACEEHAGAAELPHGPLFGVSDFDVFDRMLSDAGFRNRSLAELPIAWRFASLEPYLAAFGDWADLSRLSAAVRNGMERSVREKAKSYWTNDHYRIPNTAIMMTAEK